MGAESTGLAAVPRTVGALALLAAALPLDLAVAGVGLLRGLAPDRERAEHPRTVLISGGKMTKALALGRAFHRAGHRVVLVESAKYRLGGHRFSRAVDAFHVVPEPTAPDYVDALLAVVEDEGVDVYVPVCSPVASYQDALAKKALSAHCEVVHPDPDVVAMLDDKHRFASTAASFGLAVPETHRVTDPDQVLAFDFAASNRTWILKSIAYDPVRRMDLTPLPRPTPEETAAFVRALPITEDNPWILQEFVRGREYCTHSTVRDGRVQLHCCCPSSGFQVNYAMVDHPAIAAWVTRFVGALGVTGQLSFDFIETDDGRVVAIECNPRTHSAITMFYDHPDVARAYLEPGVPTVLPTASSRPTYWLHHELWRMLRRPSSVPERLGVILRGQDAILAPGDPLPFLLVPHLQIPLLLLDNLRRGAGWARIDLNIGKLVEPAGD